MIEKIKAFFEERWQSLLNIFVFITLGICTLDSVINHIKNGTLDYVEISFTVQTIVMLVFVLTRMEHKAVEVNILKQAVAMGAFFSGMFFMGQEKTGGELAILISSIVIFASNIFGIITLLNLGNSFGILIALRKVKVNGLYSVVRHPMYGTDIMLRVGYLISHFNIKTALLFAVSVGLYVFRAMLEEKFLSRDSEYLEYMSKVRYRFIPLIF